MRLLKIIITVYMLTSSWIFSQDLIVNEWSQGPSGGKEWVEILIVTDNLNIQNFKLIDGNNSLELIFSGIGFQNLEMGTLIVLYNGGDLDPIITPDLTYDGITDKTLQISSLNNSGTWALTRNSGWSGTGAAFSNSTTTDVPQLVNDLGSTIFTTPQHAGGDEFAYYTSNTASGATLAANWSTSTPSSNATPAAGNGGANTIWITTVLPVELSSFSAVVVREGIKLNWKTETEVNNYGFEIERLQDYKIQKLQNWETIAFVEGHGNSNSPKEYSFIDNNVSAGKYSYRLKQIDTDGKFEYSKVIEVDIGSPLKFELSQNYPNPFNPSTTIRFSLPVSTDVTITVYNLLGEKITALVNNFLEAGVHTVNFNAEGLNSGTYFYKIETADFNQMRKMTLIK